MKSKLHGEHDYFIEDHARQQRTLIPELIYCENKSVGQIILIAKKLYAKQKFVLGTRCPVEFFPKLKKTFPNAHIVQESHCFRIGKPLRAMSTAKVGIVSAGTTDIAVCEEAALVLESLGVSVERVYDVGVAGIHRLFAKDDRLKRCNGRSSSQRCRRIISPAIDRYPDQYRIWHSAFRIHSSLCHAYKLRSGYYSRKY